ncbi:MAG: TVP38/TMEM64 family protein [Deltaproteobacteria bacterium]|nr:TVP38/TMEM64 family protein [Deltaproteobacteria bacterium]MBW1952965.1 TVP38/TMEM64 family protein [Deltaproteobacteria bacterium]MBW1987491.1 TVP38/TMEM64 family protein [Deltaproteobacteria bacterium]MBW2134525.1 TVP38/TMEM64 family protein [Deltaproteobacteria bacterium]
MINTRRPLSIALLALTFMVVLGALVYAGWPTLSPYLHACYDFLSCKEKIKDFVASFGPLAPVVFILIQTFQVVAAPIPGEATGFLGGFLFGVFPGFLYSTIGLTLGSTLAFLIGRWLEVHVVAKIVSPETLEKFDFIIERQGTLVAFLLFLFPGFPKDYLCLILGLSPMPIKVFLIIVTLGRMPGTLMLSLQGAQVFQGNYYGSVIILALIIAVALPMYIYREKLYRWLRKLSGPRQSE